MVKTFTLLFTGALSALCGCSQPSVASPHSQDPASRDPASPREDPVDARREEGPRERIEPPKRAPQPPAEQGAGGSERELASAGAKKPAAEPKVPAAKGSRDALEVRRYLQRLKSRPEEAEAAFRELWSVPKELIPALILETGNTEPSQLKELKVLVLDTKGFIRMDDKEGKLVYRMKGMGNFTYDDVAAGPVKSGLGLRVIVRNFSRFPVGVVIRAALLNRFRSADYPPLDDRADPVHWWQSFYERALPAL